MNVKALVIVAVALVALGGLVAISWGQESEMPTEGDDTIYYEIYGVEKIGPTDFHGKIQFSSEPYLYAIEYNGHLMKIDGGKEFYYDKVDENYVGEFKVVIYPEISIEEFMEKARVTSYTNVLAPADLV